MCGIAGYVSRTDFDAGPIDAMTDSLAHRGPDGRGVHVDHRHGLALGHRRLKVIDLSDAGSQPMRASETDVWISYNGETYNYRSLAADLTRRGFRLTTSSDTEVVLAAYLAYGRDFVRRLDGDFALAIWDGRDATLHLYRDRFGVRPLYYAESRGTFAFASEIKALFRHPSFGKRVNMSRMGEYLGHLFVEGRETLFAGVSEVLPGEHVAVRQGHAHSRRWYVVEDRPEVRSLPDDQQVEGFMECLDRSLDQRLIADIPVGVYLSGGVDSGLLAQRLKGHQLDSLTLGFGEGCDEFEAAAVAASHAGFRHHAFTVAMENVVDQVIHHFDEPVPHMVSIPQYLLARASKPRVSVALSGTGGDELFAGYSHYRAAKALFGGGASDSADPLRADYQASLPAEMIAGEFKSCSQFHLVRRMMPSAEDYRPRYAALFQDSPYPDFLSRMLHMDIRSHLVSVLNKDDKMNMAFGIEGRFPYLDHRAVEFALAMSPHLKLRDDGVGKHVLKTWLSRHLPESDPFAVKRAFPTPAGIWLNGGKTCAYSVLRDRLGGSLDFGVIDRLVEEFQTGRVDHKRRLWGLYVLERWLVANF